MNPLEQQRAASPEQIANQPSAERQRELEDAKNALKETINGMSRKKLITMNDSSLSLLIMGCDCDIDKYASLEMESNAGNAPDMAAFYATEKLIRIKKCLENKN